MSKEKIVSFINKIGSHIVDPSKLTSATNLSTLGGSTVITIASILISFPEPNAQAIGYVLFGVGTLITVIKETKGI